MILIGLATVIAVLMALAVPRIRGMLTVPDASRRAPPAAPRTQER
jgi:predicted small lipoprotein YifL